ARAHLALMPRRRVPELLESELVLLQLDVRGHRARSVAPREVEHRGIQGVEAGEGDELELVAPAAEGLLEACDRVVVEVLTPIERRRAVVGEELAGEPLMHCLGELTRLSEVRRRSLEPDQVCVWRVCESPRDCRADAVTDAEEALPGP